LRAPHPHFVLASVYLALAVAMGSGSAFAQLSKPPTAPAEVDQAPPRLSPLADSISNYLVFAPRGDVWFTASSRGKKMLVDIGRVDAEVRRDSSRAAAYREAVAKRTSVPIGARFRLHTSWGVEEVTATAVDTWNGRIVLRLAGSPRLDSAASGKATVMATAERTDIAGTAATTSADSCARGIPFDAMLAARVTQVRDSLVQELRAGPQPAYERLQRKMSIATSQVAGCFGAARVALAVSLKAGNVEWVREKIVLIEPGGKVTGIKVNDFRFRAHDLLLAFDADGDGIDDLATRATTERAGATTILVLDLKAKKLTRLTAGFAWEDQ
jgi:hypothetical protein